MDKKKVKGIRCDNDGDYVPFGAETDLPSEEE
jgi:hypothetical protein